MLTEVAFAVEEGESDQRRAEIGSGAECVSGEHTEAARVRWHTWVDRDLHGEVSDYAALREGFVRKLPWG
jgi:hypothetical protein